MSETAFAARHSCDSPEWYTPSPFVEAAREVMFGIDLDPASHEEANQTVKAARFFTEQDDGLVRPWSGRVFLNPPGGLVREFWQALMLAWRDRNISEAVWIGYSLEQLQTLQACPLSPMHFPICVTSRRIAFVENKAKREARMAKLLSLGKNPNAASSPSHSNYITYLGANTEHFERVLSRFGVVRL